MNNTELDKQKIAIPPARRKSTDYNSLLLKENNMQNLIMHNKDLDLEISHNRGVDYKNLIKEDILEKLAATTNPELILLLKLQLAKLQTSKNTKHESSYQEDSQKKLA